MNELDRPKILTEEEIERLEETPAAGCIVSKRVGKWGPYAYRVIKRHGLQTWKYLGKILPDGSIRAPHRRVGKTDKVGLVSTQGQTK